MKFREFVLKSGIKIFLGKDRKSNDELMKMYEGKQKIILHTVAPGSPFGIIETGSEDKKPTKKEVYEAGIYVAKYSQDWRDNKKDVLVNVFTGKNVSKPRNLKPGTWNVKKAKTIKIRKEDILQIEKQKSSKINYK